MTLKETQKVLETLKELNIDENSYGWSMRSKHKDEAIKILDTELKKLEHEELKKKYGLGLMDDLSICEDCGEMAMVSYMSGGYRCKHCGAGEICF